jgi:O-methyltransferase
MHPDLEPGFVETYRACRPYTLTSVERMYALHQAVEYVHRAGLPGDIVECGVWRGGSSMLAASTLLRLGDTERNLWLYDTFEGMTEPTARDVAHTGERMVDEWDRHRGDPSSDVNCWASLHEVRANMARTGFPAERVRYVRGPVEETLPATAPDAIAILRLDTDWYESTRHELETLFPLLAPSGVLIVDDYGHWAGARQAVDEYFAEHRPVLLSRVDYTARMAVK